MFKEVIIVALVNSLVLHNFSRYPIAEEHYLLSAVSS